MAEMPEGALLRQQMIDGGAPVNDVDAWVADQHSKMIEGGAPVNDVDRYWGFAKQEFDTSLFKAAIGGAFDVLDPAQKAKAASGPLEAIQAGLQGSTGGLLVRGRNPDVVVPEDAGLMTKILAGGSQAVGDLPTIVAGAIMGTPAGAAAGTAVLPGPGTVAGAVVGGATGAGAFTGFTRAALMEQYANPNGYKDFDDAWASITHVIKETAIEGAAGAVGAVGGPIGSKIVSATGSKILGGSAAAISGAVASTAVGGGLRGQMPTAEDFFLGAIIGLGSHAVVEGSRAGRVKLTAAGQQVADTLRDVYAATGVHPREIMQRAKVDSAVMAEVLAPRTADGRRNTPIIDSMAPPEPKGDYKPTKPETPPAAKDGEVISPEKLVADNPKYMTEELVPNELTKSVLELDAATGPDAPGDLYRISPETALRYGIDPETLGDPGTSRDAAKTVLADLYRRFNGNLTDVLVAYNTDPATAASFIRTGRDILKLPVETQKFLEHAERLGVIDEGYNVAATMRVIGDTGLDTTFRDANSRTGSQSSPPTARWAMWEEHKKTLVATVGADGKIKAIDPNVVAGYMQEFAKLAGFKILIGRPASSGRSNNGPMMSKEWSADRTKSGTHIYLPNNTREAHQRWYGMEPEAVIYHEAAHAIDYNILSRNKGGGGVKFDDHPGLRDEMVAVSKEFRPGLWKENPQYNGRQNELFADAISQYLSNPSARKRMPIFSKLFGEKLKPFLEAAEKALPVRQEDGTWKMPPEDEAGPQTATGKGGGPVGPPKTPRGPEFDVPPRGPRKVTDESGDLADLIVDKEFDRLLPPEKPKGWNPALLFNEFEQELTPARRLDRLMGKDEHGLGIEDDLRGTYGSAGVAQVFLGTDPRIKGTYNVRTGKVDSTDNYADGYRIAQERGGNMEEMERYRIAKRTIEKAAQGIDTGLPLWAAEQFVARKGMAEKYDDAIAMITRTKDAVVDYARDSGLLTSKGAASMKALNRFHITLRRIIDPDYVPSVTGVSGGKFSVKSPTVKMEGSERPYISPAAMDVSNLTGMIALADRNRAVLSVLDRIAEYNKRMTEEKGGQPIPLNRVDQEILGKDEATGKPLFGEILDDEGNPIPREDYEAVAPFIAHRKLAGRLTENDFVVYRDGKLEIYRSTNEYLTRALRAGTDPASTNAWVETLGWFANVQRRGITADIGFVFRSLALGQWSAAVNAEGVRMMPFKEIFKGFGVPDHLYEMWIANGGASTALGEINRNYVQTDMAKIFEKTDTLSNMWNVVRHPLEAVSALSHYLDTRARLGRFVGNIEGGIEPKKAAMISRTAQLDYSERFAKQWMNSWGRMVPFLTTGFKDLGQWTAAFRDRPTEAGLRALMYITVPTIGVTLASYFQDQFLPEELRYSNIDQNERNAYFISPLMYLPGTDPHSGIRFKIKRPYTGGFFFSTLPEQFIRFVAEQDPKAFKGILGTFAMQVAPPVLSVGPATPFLEHMVGNKLYNFSELLPARLERLTGPMQYKDDTTETAKKLHAVLGAGSPIVTENYARGWLGPLPLTVLRILEGTANKVIPGLDVGSGKPLQLADVPFLGSFFLRNRPGGEALSRYYDDAREFDAAHADLVMAIERQDLGEIKRSANPLAAVRLSEARRAISEQIKVINAINVNKTMTNAEKLKYTDTVAASLVSTAKAASKAMAAIREAQPALTAPALPGTIRP